MTTYDHPARTTGLLAPVYRWATIGMVGLILLVAFEELAVTTVMPIVTAALDGRAWFSVAFSATLAASVVGMVGAGLLADRTGPSAPLLGAAAIFALGLLVAGAASSIEVFVAARFLQGLGAGGITVALYVLVARVYAPVDHPRIFGAFAAAWVLPSVVGPTVAGLVAQTIGWRWVFLGVVAVALLAICSLLPALRRLEVRPAGPVMTGAGRRLLLSVAVAAGVVLLDVGGRLSGPLRFVVAALAIGAVLVSVRRLLPAGTLVVRRGLPAVVALRGLIAATFFSAEIYLPYLLQEHYDVPPWLSGVTLTVGALGWAAASQVQARMGARLTSPRALWVGALLLLVGVAGSAVTAALHLPPYVLALAWVFAASGMGLQYPRISVLVLAASTEHQRGANTASMSIAEAAGAATAISVAGLLFTAVGTAAATAPFAVALAFCTLVGVVAVATAARCAEPGTHLAPARTR